MSEEDPYEEGKSSLALNPDAPPPIWVVKKFVPINQLQSCLNQVADQGYQVKDILQVKAPHNHRYLAEGTDCAHVIAFDGTRIMEKQTKDMQAQMTALMGTIPTPSTPGGFPGK